MSRDLLGGPAVGTLCFHFKGACSISGGGTKIPQTAQCSQKKSRDAEECMCYVHSCGKKDRGICKKTYVFLHTYIHICTYMYAYAYIHMFVNA